MPREASGVLNRRSDRAANVLHHAAIDAATIAPFVCRSLQAFHRPDKARDAAREDRQAQRRSAHNDKTRGRTIERIASMAGVDGRR